MIDGVNVTNQGYGALGSYSIIFGSLGNATPFDFIQEVQVKTGGYEAEFGQSTGGVVNVDHQERFECARADRFRLHAAVAARRQLDAVPDRQRQRADGRHAQLGCRRGRRIPAPEESPVLLRRDRSGSGVRDIPGAGGFPAAAWAISIACANPDYSTKGTWQIANAHRIDASFFGDPSKGDNGPQRASSLLVEDTSSFSSLDYGGHNQTVRYSGVLGANWLLEASFARALNRINEMPSVNAWRVTDQTVSPNVITGGIGLYEAGNRSLNRSVRRQVHQQSQRPPAQIRLRVRRRGLRPDQSAHRSDVHARRTDGRRPPARKSPCCRIRPSARSTA